MNISLQVLILFFFCVGGVSASNSDASSSLANSPDTLPSSGSNNSNNNSNNSNSVVMIMNTGNRLSGVTYEESFDMAMSTTLQIGAGEPMETTVLIQMDSETKATDLLQGGQSVHMTITHIAYQADTGMMTSECDTDENDDRKDSSSSSSSLDSNKNAAYCEPFYDLLTDMDFVVDDRGVIAESSAAQDIVQSSGAADHLKASARLLGFIPSRPIKEGESWDSSMDLQDLGYFEGTSTFLGMDEENGCALISIVGDLDIDFQALSERMGGPILGMQEQDISITDSLMAAKVCWNDSSKMTAWSETDMSFTMHMANPMNANDELEMPIHEVVKTTCKVKEN